MGDVLVPGTPTSFTDDRGSIAVPHAGPSTVAPTTTKDHDAYKPAHVMIKEGAHVMIKEGAHAMITEGAHVMINEGAHVMINEGADVMISKEGAHVMISKEGAHVMIKEIV